MPDQEGIRRVEKTTMHDLGVMTMNVTPPGGRRFWLEDSMLPQGRRGQVKPSFKIGEVAKNFFARSSDWLRWLSTMNDQQGGIFELNGEPLEVKRTAPGARVYTLVDVERLAHALLEHDKIDVYQFVAAINMVRWMACAYKILDPEDMVAHDPVSEMPQQPPIDGIDEQIAEVIAKQVKEYICPACEDDRHNDCDVAAEIATRTWRGVEGEPEGFCRCYEDNPQEHG